MDKTHTLHNCIRTKLEDMPDSLEPLLSLQELLWSVVRMDCMVQHGYGKVPVVVDTPNEELLHTDWVLVAHKLVLRRNDYHIPGVHLLVDTVLFLENEIVILTATVDILLFLRLNRG